jgi:hypothetical protein
MEDYKKQALDEIAMQNLSDQETINRLRIVFKTPTAIHAVIAFASSVIVRKAKGMNNDGLPTTSAVMKSLLDDIQYMKRLAQCLKDNTTTKDNEYEDFI